ncbi:hypothetical protein CRN61_08770 [Vibrio vulnificus]|nr:hypothetical protein CRN61_08770 [Vibrio vulnificus]
MTLLVGSGNNGGDALYAGAFLARRGAAVTAVLCAEKAHLAGLSAFQAAGGRTMSLAKEFDHARRSCSSAP